MLLDRADDASKESGGNKGAGARFAPCPDKCDPCLRPSI